MENYKEIEENDSSESFELFDPIIEPIVEPKDEPKVGSNPGSIGEEGSDSKSNSNPNEYQLLPSFNSMSIVTIPDEFTNNSGLQLDSKAINDMNERVMLSQKISLSDNNNDHCLETTRVESFMNSSQNDLRIEELSNLEKQLDEDLKSSMKTLVESNSLAENKCKVESEKDSVYTDLESYLKELREENQKFKSVIERNNIAMKLQLEKLHEWQNKNKHTVEQNQKIAEESKAVIEQLKDENNQLKEELKKFEGMAGLKSVDELNDEITTLRSKCDQLSSYQKIDVSAELENQNLSAQMIDAKRTIDTMKAGINSLRTELCSAKHELESMALMKSQLMIYERDFKMEADLKTSALKRVDELEKELEVLRKAKSELDEKLDKGEPVIDLKPEATGSKSYSCPKCWRSFKGFQAIQNHFERCLDEDGIFT